MFTEMMMSAGSGGGTPRLIEATFNTTETYTIKIKNGVFSWLGSTDVSCEYVFIDGVMTTIAKNIYDNASYDGTTFSISNAYYGNKSIKIFMVN